MTMPTEPAAALRLQQHRPALVWRIWDEIFREEPTEDIDRFTKEPIFVRAHFALAAFVILLCVGTAVATIGGLGWAVCFAIDNMPTIGWLALAGGVVGLLAMVWMYKIVRDIISVAKEISR